MRTWNDMPESGSYFGNENRGGEEEKTYYGSSTDAYDIRYTDDCHMTYGKQYDEEDD